MHCSFSFLILACAACYSQAFKNLYANESTCPIDLAIIKERRYICHMLDHFTDGSKFSYLAALNEAGENENVIQLLDKSEKKKLAQFKLKFSQLNVSLTDVSDEEAELLTKEVPIDDDDDNAENDVKNEDSHYITRTWPKATTTFNVSFERVGSKIKLMVNEQLLSTFDYPESENLDNPLNVHILGPRLNITRFCYVVNEKEEVSTESLDTTCKGGNEEDCNKLDMDETKSETCLIYRSASQSGGKIPYTRLQNGFEDGKMLSIKATVNKDAKRFILDILDTNHSVAFHLKVEPKKNSIVLSRREDAYWVDQARSPNLWFKPNQAFKLDVYREGNYFLMYLNSHLIARFEISNSQNLEPAAYFHIFGHITAKSACYKDSDLPPLPEFNSDSMLDGNCEHKWDNQKLYKMPYTKLPNVLTSNHSIIMHVTPYIFKDRFVINLLDKEHNRMLHLKADRRKISLTGFKAREEVIRNKPLVINESAKFEIVNTGKRFEVFLNGTLLGSSPNQKRDPHFIYWYGNGLVSGLCLKPA